MEELVKRIVEINAKINEFEMDFVFNENDVRYKNWVDEKRNIYDVLKFGKFDN